jgi:RNA polymerase sigma-70 factor (ECF subfamily)
MEEDLDLPDVELLIAVRSGDERAFVKLYTKYSTVVLRYAWTKLGERSSAEDITQDTFVIVWSKRMSAVIVGDSLLPWVLAVSRNLLNNELRKRANRSRLSARLAQNEVERQPLDQELAWMRAEFRSLSPTDRTLCWLCLVEGFTYRQAAELIESSESAVSKRIQRARARLRIALGQQ